MKRFLAVSMLLFALPAMAAVVDFEDMGLGDEAYWNGSDTSGGFQSGNAYFLNNYNETYGSWDGFAASTTTDTTDGTWNNAYSAITGSGVNSSKTYALSYIVGNSALSLTDHYANGSTVEGFYVTNTTNAYGSIQDGDAFSKKFGGETGDDADWFKLTIKGITAAGEYTQNVVDFYLADYRFADNSQDYIVDDWRWVDLTSLGDDIIGLEFALSSSDNGQWGMNTPSYFAMDNLTFVPEPASMLLLGLGLAFVRRNKK